MKNKGQREAPRRRHRRTVSAWVPEATWAELRAEAARRGTTVAALLAQAIREMIAKWRAEQGAKSRVEARAQEPDGDHPPP
jgi:hypothetical protein